VERLDLEGVSMVMSLDVQFFWVSFWCYLFGWIAFTAWLGVKKPFLPKLGSTLFVLGFLPQTAGFLLRWYNTGHYPMSNMYEYLAVMSWMAVLSFGILTYRYRNWVISALISPIVVMLMVAASLLPKDPSQQLMPALQSKWLMIHVSLASIGAGAFAVAAAVSLVYLFGVRTEEEASRGFRPSMKVPFQLLVIVPIVIAVIGGLTGVLAKQSTMELFGAPSHVGHVLILLGIYLVFAGFLWVWLMQKASDLDTRYWSAVAFVALFIGALAAGALIQFEQVHLSVGSPLRIFEFFGITLIFGTIMVFLTHALLGFGRVAAVLHLDGHLLDEINYRAVTLGYPLYTLGALFAGAIWAEAAWGAFWSWDPKEVGALIIWLFYSAYLHARYQRGWTGTRTAVLSLTGFAMMMLSFFGNYFFGGQHSYN
jgi:ABC-type transport system involved in cytochrome c biogenesis permease subunit